MKCLPSLDMSAGGWGGRGAVGLSLLIRPMLKMSAISLVKSGADDVSSTPPALIASERKPVARGYEPRLGQCRAASRASAMGMLAGISNGHAGQ